jgi:hypothetical protein
MNDQFDELSALYHRARVDERSTRADRKAVRAGIAAAMTLGVDTASASAPAIGSKGAVQLLFGGKFLGGLLVGAAIGTVVSTAAYVSRPKKHPVVAVASTAHAGAAVASSQSAIGVLPQVQTIDSGRPPRLPPEPKPGNAVPSTVQVLDPTRSPTLVLDEAPIPSQDRLMRETVALAEVQAALNRRDANKALVLLGEQERAFPMGQLAEERAAAKVLALCALGRTSEAELARSSFVLSHPNSPLTRRVQKSCEQ